VPVVPFEGDWSFMVVDGWVGSIGLFDVFPSAPELGSAEGPGIPFCDGVWDFFVTGWVIPGGLF
jgi:hypothetical protein